MLYVYEECRLSDINVTDACRGVLRDWAPNDSTIVVRRTAFSGSPLEVTLKRNSIGLIRSCPISRHRTLLTWQLFDAGTHLNFLFEIPETEEPQKRRFLSQLHFHKRNVSEALRGYLGASARWMPRRAIHAARRVEHSPHAARTSQQQPFSWKFTKIYLELFPLVGRPHYTKSVFIISWPLVTTVFLTS
jgi:hypothetical protein